MRDELRMQAQTLGLDPAVIFCGIRQDIPAVMSALDILVLSSKWEGLPVTLLEGMAARRPIVSTAVGGVPNVTANGEAALLVPPQDSFALANACIKILQDPLYAQSVAAAGFERVKKYYSLDAMIGKTLKLYEYLLEHHGAHTSS